MINIRNILKVLLVALFVCAYSGDVRAGDIDRNVMQLGNAMQSTYPFASDSTIRSIERAAKNAGFTGNGAEGRFIADFMEKVARKEPGYNITFGSDGWVKAGDSASRKNQGVAALLAGIPGAVEYQKEVGGSTLTTEEADAALAAAEARTSGTSDVDTSNVGNSQQNATFCSADLGIFTELVQTGRTIFNRLRDLIYVVAGFGIIAVAVGGFFGNLNWKWLGAIIISLVVMATAGEIIVLITGCDKFDDSLITNTLAEPTDTLDASYNVGEGGSKTVREYNDYYVGQESAEGTEGNTEGEEPVSEGEAPAE